MTNRLYLRGSNNLPLGNMDIDIVWGNGDSDISRSNKNGTAFFSGEGVVSHVIVAGETIEMDVEVEGCCTVVAVFRYF